MDVSDKVAEAIFSHTDGNCLFVKELVRALDDEIVAGSVDPLKIEATVRRHSTQLLPLIAKRLGSLAERSRDILQTAALLGREFSLKKLSAVAGAEKPVNIDAALTQACHFSLLEKSSDENDRYIFVHALYQDALIADLGPMIAARRRCAIGLSLEEYYHESADEHAVELAGFLVEPETDREKERCYHYSFIAGEQAWSQYAVDDMQKHFFNLYDLKEYRKSDAELGRIYQALGPANSMMWQDDEANRTAILSWNSYFDAGDSESALQLVTHYGTSIRLEYPPCLAALERALAFAKQDSANSAIITAYLGVAEHFSGRLESLVFSRMNESRAIAHRLNDPRCKFIEMESRGIVLQSYRKTKSNELRSLILEMLDLEAANPSMPIHDERRIVLAQRAFSLGKVEPARAIVRRLLSQGRNNRMPSAMAEFHHHMMVSHQLEGDWDEARRCCDRALDEKKINNSYHHTCALRDRSILEFQLGNYKSGERYAVAMREASREIDIEIARRQKKYGRKATNRSACGYFGSCLGSTLALITDDDRFLADHRDFYRTQRADVIQQLESGREWTDVLAYLSWHSYWAGYAAEAILENNLALAEECFDALKDDESTMLIPRFWFGHINGRILGLLKLTSGDFGAAVRYFDESYLFCKAEGLNPMLAWICHDYARALLLRGDSEDQTGAERLLQEGLSIATTLGMRPVASKCTDLLAQNTNGEKQRHRDGLTPREVEVLCHVARGKTNQEIGRDLNISENTVSNHIKNIFAKTGTTNRVAASSYAIFNGLATAEPSDESE